MTETQGQPSQTETGGQTDESGEPVAPSVSESEISFSRGLANFLASQNISVAFTSYQSGGLYLLGHADDGKLALHEARYPQAMGLVGNQDRIYLGTLTEVVRLENVLSPGQLVNSVHDRLYVPRNFQVTGSIDIHELGVRKNGVMVFINTSYSCLCEPSITHSFKPIWKPRFISKLAPEDRCHLNGLAMVDGEPKYASAVCRSDVIDGWRDRRRDGGVIIDIQTDEIVAQGLSMPHSPRWYDGRLWVLNSGTGELGFVEPKTKSFEPLTFCPGFLRGLSFHNGYAFVTLSKPRIKRFDGLALGETLDAKDADAWCGVQVINLSSGDVAQWLRFDGSMSELFDVCVLPGEKNPLTIGPGTTELQEFITIDTPSDPLEISGASRRC